MHPIDQVLSAAVRAILLVDRPAGLPLTVAIHATVDEEPLERPYLVSFCEDGTSPHPHLRVVTLVMRLRSRTDDSEVTAAGAWHKAAVDYFLANPAALHATLEPLGYALIKFTAINFGDALGEDRGHEFDQRWKVWLHRTPGVV
jgi:hypothetical protein